MLRGGRSFERCPQRNQEKTLCGLLCAARRLCGKNLRRRIRNLAAATAAAERRRVAGPSEAVRLLRPPPVAPRNEKTSRRSGWSTQPSTKPRPSAASRAVSHASSTGCTAGSLPQQQSARRHTQSNSSLLTKRARDGDRRHRRINISHHATNLPQRCSDDAVIPWHPPSHAPPIAPNQRNRQTSRLRCQFPPVTAQITGPLSIRAVNSGHRRGHFQLTQYGENLRRTIVTNGVIIS